MAGISEGFSTATGQGVSTLNQTTPRPSDLFCSICSFGFQVRQSAPARREVGGKTHCAYFGQCRLSPCSPSPHLARRKSHETPIWFFGGCWFVFILCRFVNRSKMSRCFCFGLFLVLSNAQRCREVCDCFICPLFYARNNKCTYSDRIGYLRTGHFALEPFLRAKGTPSVKRERADFHNRGVVNWVCLNIGDPLKTIQKSKRGAAFENGLLSIGPTFIATTQPSAPARRAFSGSRPRPFFGRWCRPRSIQIAAWYPSAVVLIRQQSCGLMGNHPEAIQAKGKLKSWKAFLFRSLNFHLLQMLLCFPLSVLTFSGGLSKWKRTFCRAQIDQGSSHSAVITAHARGEGGGPGAVERAEGAERSVVIGFAPKLRHVFSSFRRPRSLPVNFSRALVHSL